MNTDTKNLQQNTSKLNSAAYWKGYTPLTNRFYSWNARIVQHTKIYQRIYHINRMKEKTNMIFSINAGKFLVKFNTIS